MMMDNLVRTNSQAILVQKSRNSLCRVALVIHDGVSLSFLAEYNPFLKSFTKLSMLSDNLQSGKHCSLVVPVFPL